MSTQLTDQEAQELFAQASAAIKDADGAKLTEIMTADEPEDDADQDDQDEEDVDSEGTDTVEDAGEDDVDTEGTSADEAEDDADDKGNKQVDELKELRDQLQAMQKENHALRSQAGRMPHIQRKLKELDAKLEELNTKTASPSSRPSAAINEKVKQALKGIGETDAELAQAVAEAIQLAITGQEEDALNRERETLKLFREQEYASYREAEVERLLNMYPNAPEVFASPTWKQWKSSQSERVQALALSDNADEVALAFKLYADDMVKQNPQLAKVSAADAPAATAENEQKAAQIEQARKRRQAASAHVGSSNAPGKVRLPDDPEALFKKYSEEIRKSISGQ